MCEIVLDHASKALILYVEVQKLDTKAMIVENMNARMMQSYNLVDILEGCPISHADTSGINEHMK